jgi:acetyltransferase-like isoleucine patch superfamily enzyme
MRSLTAEQQEQHDRLVAMLQEQADMGKAVVYEPVVQVRPERITIGDGSRVDSFCKLEGGEGLRIGRYVHIASFAHIGIGGGTTEIGDFAAVASHGVIISGSNQPDVLSMSACAPQDIQRVERKVTRLERYAVVLAHATVLPGVTLHEGAVLAAGAVATKDIPAWEIWAGVPARRFRYRLIGGKCQVHKLDKVGSALCPACMLERERAS